MNAMPGHLTPEFMAMMSGLVHAMRTWQRDPGGGWRIAVDISTPLPRP